MAEPGAEQRVFVPARTARLIPVEVQDREAVGAVRDVTEREVGFGPFEVRWEQDLLLRDGQRVEIQSQPWKVLQLLLSRPGRLVTREEIRRILWGTGFHVDHEQGINFCIYQLRAALGDSAHEPRYVETVPRQGYRFIADVEPVAEAEPHGPRRDLRPIWRFAGMGSLLVVAGLSFWTAYSADRGPSANAPKPEALRWYESGLRRMDEDIEGRRQAVVAFERALEISSEYAPAHAAWAATQMRLFRPPREVMPAAERAIDRALELDPELAEAHRLKGTVALYYHYDRESAERSFRRALELEPNSADSHSYLAFGLSAQGRHDEAIEALETALTLDADRVATDADGCWLYLFAREFQDALREAERTLASRPSEPWGYLCAIPAALGAGDTERAFHYAQEELRVAVENNKIAPPDRPIETLDDYWRWSLERYAAWTVDRFVPPTYSAGNLAALGLDDGAVDALMRSCQLRAGVDMPFVAVDPRFENLHGHPGFRKVLECARAAGPSAATGEGADG